MFLVFLTGMILQSHSVPTAFCMGCDIRHLISGAVSLSDENPLIAHGSLCHVPARFMHCATDVPTEVRVHERQSLHVLRRVRLWNTACKGVEALLHLMSGGVQLQTLAWYGMALHLECLKVQRNQRRS